jgi:hypothetical protein
MLEKQRLEREKRLQKLFAQKTEDDGDSDDDINRLLDQNATIKNYDATLGKIDSFLRAEMRLLNAWS